MRPEDGEGLVPVAHGGEGARHDQAEKTLATVGREGADGGNATHLHRVAVEPDGEGECGEGGCEPAVDEGAGRPVGGRPGEVVIGRRGRGKYVVDVLLVVVQFLSVSKGANLNGHGGISGRGSANGEYSRAARSLRVP